MPILTSSCVTRPWWVNEWFVIDVGEIFSFLLINNKLHQPRLCFFTGGYLVKGWFIPAAARARGQSNDLNREILASNLFNCHKEVINAPPVPSISRCIHIVYRHKKVWEYQWSNFIYNCMSTFLHYVHCKDALFDCSAPGGERCESLTWVDEIGCPRCSLLSEPWHQPCVHKSIQPTNQVLWASAPTALTYFPPGLVYYTRWCNINCHGVCMQSDDWMYLPYECNTNVVPDHLHAEWWLNVPPL